MWLIRLIRGSRSKPQQPRQAETDDRLAMRIDVVRLDVHLGALGDQVPQVVLPDDREHHAPHGIVRPGQRRISNLLLPADPEAEMPADLAARPLDSPPRPVIGG